MTDGRVLAITGASSGIGAATARAAAAAGYRVVLASRRLGELEALAESLGGDGTALAVGCDVGLWEDNERLIRRAIDVFGRVDAVLANAGFGASYSFLDDDPETWRALVTTNVLGAGLTIRAALPHLLERGDGHLLLTGSVAGRVALPGSMYSVTKWAVSAMAEALRAELRRTHRNHGIRVTLVSPGMVETPFFDPLRDSDLALRAENVAAAVMYALEQPANVDVNEIVIRPVGQSV
jgi:NADP-dependent 3-hydroxy acid dehydrogenase YdfG